MWISSTDSLNLLDNIINKAKSKDKDTIQSKHKFRSECNCTILLDRTIWNCHYLVKSVKYQQ